MGIYQNQEELVLNKIEIATPTNPLVSLWVILGKLLVI